MVANLSVVERERDFAGVEGTGAIVQHGRPPRIYIRVCRRATQSSLPDSLLERRAAKGSGGNDGIQIEWSRFRVIAPVGVDDRLAGVAKFFLKQSVKFFHSHRIGIGTVEPTYSFVEIFAELLDRMDDEEVCGRPLSAPNRIRRTLCEAKIWAEAFSSWLPPRRPKVDQPGLAAVRSTAIWINSALRPPAQPVVLSNQERAI